MKRKIRLPQVLLLAAVVLICSGCGKEADKPMPEQTEAEEITVEETESETEATIPEEEQKRVPEEVVAIEGLTESYEFLFLTDSHVIVPGENDTEQIAENAAPRYELFQSYEGLPAAQQFQEWMEYAEAVRPDGVLLGGDIIDYPSETNVEYLGEQLEKLTAAEIPYLYTLGNHDWTYPWEYMTEAGREAYLPMLAPYMQGEGAIRTFDYGEFLIAAIDNSGNQISEETLAEYTELLQENRPIIVLLHVPLATTSVLERAEEVWGEGVGVVLGAQDQGGIEPTETSKKFIELTTAADSPVELVLAGHVHFHERDYIEGEKKVLQIVGEAGYKGAALRLIIKGK